MKQLFPNYDLTTFFYQDDSNGGNVSKDSAEYEYEDIEIDDDDELLDDEDDEYNEITEAPSSLLTMKNLMPESAPKVSGC